MIQPIEDKVVIKTIEDAQVTKSGIIITGDKEKPQEAIVVAVGSGAKFADGTTMELAVEVGDKVIFSKYQGTEIEHDGKKYLIIAYRDIFAVINE